MTPTTIDKDDPTTWPPDSEELVALQWESGEDGSIAQARAFLREIRTAPNDYHGDRWWLLEDTQPECVEPERVDGDGLVEVRVAVAVSADGDVVESSALDRSESAADVAWMGRIYIDVNSQIPCSVSIITARVRPYTEPEPDVVVGVVEDAD
jgi:uncharacterized membrane protein